MKELVLQYSVWGKKLDKPLHCTIEKVAKGPFYYWHVTSIEYPFIGVGDTQKEAWECFEKTVIHDIKNDKYIKENAEIPAFVAPEVAEHLYCPFVDGKCNGSDCMMWVWKGETGKGRCGLVQWTQIFATTPCVSCGA